MTIEKINIFDLKTTSINGIKGVTRIEIDTKGEWQISEIKRNVITFWYSEYHKKFVKPYLFGHFRNTEILLFGGVGTFDLSIDILSEHKEEIVDYIKKLLSEDYCSCSHKTKIAK